MRELAEEAKQAIVDRERSRALALLEEFDTVTAAVLDPDGGS